VLNNIGMYDLEFKYCLDIDIFLRILFAGFQGANLPYFLLKYRKHPASTDSNYKDKVLLPYKARMNIIKSTKQIDFKSLFFIHADLFVSFFPYRIKSILNKFVKLIFKIR
jgi:hypothetical protein